KKPKMLHFCDYRNFENKICVGLREATSRSASVLAEATTTVEFQLVLEIGESALVRDLFFQMLHRARDVEDLDGAAVPADEVVLVMILTQAVVRRPTVEADAADDAALFEAAHETVEGRGIAGDVEG